MGKNVWSAGGMDVEARLRKQERCLLVAGVCLIGGSVLVLGWLVYAACVAFPVLEKAFIRTGFVLMGFGGGQAVKAILGR
jgi:hypothetical protein